MRNLIVTLILVATLVALASEDHDHEGDSQEAHSAGEGFKVPSQALKNFELKTKKLEGQGPWLVPTSARVFSAEEVNIYRLRSGAFARIDFEVVKETKTEMQITSRDLTTGDELVTVGVGFLRIAELAASGGVSHGHSH